MYLHLYISTIFLPVSQFSYLNFGARQHTIKQELPHFFHTHQKRLDKPISSDNFSHFLGEKWYITKGMKDLCFQQYSRPEPMKIFPIIKYLKINR